MVRCAMMIAGFIVAFWLTMLQQAAFVHAQIRTSRHKAICELSESCNPADTSSLSPRVAWRIRSFRSGDGQFVDETEPAVYVGALQDILINNSGDLLYSIPKELLTCAPSVRFDAELYPFHQDLFKGLNNETHL